jgi:hypothetical protein
VARGTDDVVELKVAARVWFWGEIGVERGGGVAPKHILGCGRSLEGLGFELEIKSEFSWKMESCNVQRLEFISDKIEGGDSKRKVVCIRFDCPTMKIELVWGLPWREGEGEGEGWAFGGELGPLLLWFGPVLCVVHGGRRSRKEEEKRRERKEKKGRKKEKGKFPKLGNSQKK